jgi:UDP-GlcNAc:undecaprenyl-phosphate GlcNAc-1-phosphate transferase
MLTVGEFTWLQLLGLYWPVLAVSFVVAVIATPVARKVAHATGVVDHPDESRKIHRKPIAYLGGVAVLVAVLAGIATSSALISKSPLAFQPVPTAIILGMLAIAFTGFADDALGWDPWLKTAGQLVAAAALAIEDVGTKVAAGFCNGVFGTRDIVFPIPGTDFNFDVVYWLGTAVIAIFVLGGCNAANLIDGLDGLLSGIVAITAAAFLVLGLMLAMSLTPDVVDRLREAMPVDAFGDQGGDGVTLDGVRIMLPLAVLGASLGFLIYNFNQASIFLGDTGSLLFGYLCVVMILMLGERGHTHYVVAGLIIFAVPIMDTALAIIRRKIAGKPMSEPDSNHIHHILKRKLGTVKKTVLSLYLLSAAFAVLGIFVARLHLTGGVGAWLIYFVAAVLFGGVGFIAVRSARRHGEA